MSEILKRELFLCCLVAAVSVACRAAAQDKRSADPLGLSVKASLDRKALAIKMELALKPDKAVTIYESDLPWKNHDSIVIVAANLRGEPLNRSLPIDDPGPATIEIKGQYESRGTIDLQYQFPTLADEINKRDVLIFWSYQLRSIDGVPSERVGGWFLVPKAVDAVKATTRPH